METCSRGFSFMPEKVESLNLQPQLIETDELERTWKHSQRQRLRQREDKIWQQFCGEQDAVDSVCSDDPYQFLEQLPESYLKELIEKEYDKMKKNIVEVEQPIVIVQEQEEEVGKGDAVEMEQPHHTQVTFAESDDSEVIQIFDDRQDQPQAEDSEEEDKCESPATVREASPAPTAPAPAPTPAHTPATAPADPPAVRAETGLIESSIYCAKLKELRWKINEALLDFMDSVQSQSLTDIYPENVAKLKKHSVEFNARFNRVYMYQLHRQLSDVKRHISHTLPYAKHTHFQAHMVRVISLHQNILQAILVYYKCFGQSLLLAETSAQLRQLLRALRDCSALCVAPPAPAPHLYNDDILSTCDNVEEMLIEYDKKIEKIITFEEETAKKPSADKLRGHSGATKTKAKRGAEKRLAMYSLNKVGSHVTVKPSSSNTSKSKKSSTNLVEAQQAAPQTNQKVERAEKEAEGNTKKKNKCGRRPLKAPPRPRAPRLPPQHEPRTLVEAVPRTVSSSVVTNLDSFRSPKSKQSTPRTQRSNLSSPKTSRSVFSTPRTVRSNQSTPKNSPKCVQSPRRGRALKGKGEEAGNLYTIASEQEVQYYVPDYAQKECVTQTDCGERTVEDGACQYEVDKEMSDMSVGGLEVSALLHKLCGGGGGGGGSGASKHHEHVSGSRNAQLFCINSFSSPRQPTTPQLLKILEETIQKKPLQRTPAPGGKQASMDRHLLGLCVPERSRAAFRDYRGRFVRHMLSSAMYANGDVAKPWELVGRVSEKVVEELLASCAKEMQLNRPLQRLYRSEIR